jgi:hypothetical protein
MLFTPQGQAFLDRETEKVALNFLIMSKLITVQYVRNELKDKTVMNWWGITNLLSTVVCGSHLQQ